MSIKKSIYKTISNLPGWRTRRRIIVFECDDWGSVYMTTSDAFADLKKKGFNLSSRYLTNDTLESNDDLELLLDVLSRHKDASGRNIVMTGVNIVANPDFNKIKANGYLKYEYELFTDTCKKFKGCDRVYELWKEGINNRLLFPTFHGREHLNIKKWMNLLQSNDRTIKTIFEYGIPYIGNTINGSKIPDLRAAFEIDNFSEIEDLKKVIITGLDEFEKLYNFRTKYFIPTNGPFNSLLEDTLSDCGIHFIGTEKIHSESIGNNKYKKHFRYLGMKNRFDQIYLTRNCFFEPNSSKHSSSKDWVNDCLKDIEISFNCLKPATISSHRVNFTGSINPANRKNGLLKLDLLFKEIIKRWPNVEFLTTEELGAEISNNGF